MDNLEKVEKIREKTGVSYEDAKTALEACDYDILDAIVYLEKLGKIKAPEVTSYSTTHTETSNDFALAQADYHESCRKKTIGDGVDKFVQWCKRIIKKGMEVTFAVQKDDKKIMEIPVLIFVLLVIFLFWVTVPLLIIGLFCDFKYHFNGVDKMSVDINEMCDKASDACGNIKNDIKNS